MSFLAYAATPVRALGRRLRQAARRWHLRPGAHQLCCCPCNTCREDRARAVRLGIVIREPFGCPAATHWRSG